MTWMCDSAHEEEAEQNTPLNSCAAITKSSIRQKQHHLGCMTIEIGIGRKNAGSPNQKRD